MTYHKTYTIPFRLLPAVQCGFAIGPEREKLVSLYWEFETLAGKGWQVHPVSFPEMSANDVTDGQELSVEIDLVS